MIEEVLKDIAEAEERAEEIRRDAVVRCKEKVFAAESAAEALKNDTAAECKAAYKAAIAAAEERAAAERAAIIADGEKRAAELAAEKKGEVAKTADEVLAVFVAKYTE